MSQATARMCQGTFFILKMKTNKKPKVPRQLPLPSALCKNKEFLFCCLLFKRFIGQFADRLQNPQMRLQGECINGQFRFFRASIHTACCHNPAEQFCRCGRGRRFCPNSRESREAMPQPHQLETPLASVRSAASAVQISSPCGTPARISRRKVPIPICCRHLRWK